MRHRESLRISWRSIRSHKLRSTLTTLGVILGVGAVITFMVLGGAFTEDIVGDLEENEEPGMIVTTQTTPEDGFGVMFVNTPIYTEHDISSLAALEDVAYAAPLGGLSVNQVAAGDDIVTGVITVQATTEPIFEYDEFVDGEPFTEGTAEAVINTEVVQLFGGDLAVGDSITLTMSGEQESVTIAGIIDEPDALLSGPNIYVPTEPYYTTVIETPRGTNERAYGTLVVSPVDADATIDVRERVIDYFDGDADATQLKQDDHDIVVQTVDDAIEQVTDIIGQLTIFIAGIAAISLVVGSIGIANIMIVSVTERTRNIGIMKAVGARKRDIMQLFLVESVILGIIGSFFGVALGLGIGYLGVSLIGWSMVFPIDWILIAVGVGVSVGLISGIYPAWRAAKVDPIEALRYE